MSNETAMQVLVIGSNQHDRADVVWWLKPSPNVEEFDAVIIDMNTLDQSSLDYILRNDPDKLGTLRDEIYTLFTTGRNPFEVFEGLSEWKYEIEPFEDSKCTTKLVAVNRSGKMIAAETRNALLMNRGPPPTRQVRDGSVFLLSPTEDAPGEAIEILIDIVLGKREKIDETSG
jgi:hypothetical protein